jgi:hypothetical protein
MANKILTAAGWQARVRSLMGGIDPAYLPDADLEQPDIIDVAEANITERVPDYAAILAGSDANKKVWLTTATVLECAILACPGMFARIPKYQQGPSESHEVSMNWGQLERDLIDERETCIAKTKGTTFIIPFGLSQ